MWYSKKGYLKKSIHSETDFFLKSKVFGNAYRRQMHVICMFLNYTDRIIEKFHKMNEGNILMNIFFYNSCNNKINTIKFATI